MIYMPFLYFPEDKSEYLPSVIMLIIFMSFAVLALYFFIKKSRKEEKKFEEKYKDVIDEIEKEDSEKNK
ncbi:hypothetical protein M3210_07955 [Oceanobacillus luteolus]|uniref:Uncharacterized protein n=1 Tax=Oceanobacillus luteolus TaxID=1274358 RepID=A0ABW4HPU2_9BACI|nr:hypothetical protein [Oceanobacillus luteolus]MCM3740200.1 hypothetical protein [Oceanobacillus luteolus]